MSYCSYLMEKHFGISVDEVSKAVLDRASAKAAILSTPGKQSVMAFNKVALDNQEEPDVKHGGRTVRQASKEDPVATTNQRTALSKWNKEKRLKYAGKDDIKLLQLQNRYADIKNTKLHALAKKHISDDKKSIRFEPDGALEITNPTALDNYADEVGLRKDERPQRTTEPMGDIKAKR